MRPLPAQFVRSAKAALDKADQWLAYCAFHLGDYQRARQVRATGDWGVILT